MTAPLPGVLASIEAVAGRDAALKLALAVGGTDLYIPRRAGAMTDAHPLAAALGRDAAHEIIRRSGGCQIYIPRARRALAMHLARGRSAQEIAGVLGCTRSTIRQYLRVQGNMFP